MPKSYQPGQRRPAYGENHQIQKDRYAWVVLEMGKFLILVGEDKGSGPDVVLFNPRPGKMPDISYKLTNMTLEELDAFEELIKTALEWARPVVERRDKEAQDAWDAGDDSYSRSYRALPTVVYRKRPVDQHGPSGPSGPERVSEGDGDGGGGPDGVRGAGDGVAEPEPPASGSDDDGA